MLSCFTKAAELPPYEAIDRVVPHEGVAAAENELGVCYRDGLPSAAVTVDVIKAFDFFLRAAEHEWPLGQYHVALAYSTGTGTSVNATAARLWTTRAAQHDLPEVQHLLAHLVATGRRGKKDDKLARTWAARACRTQLTDLVMTPESSRSRSSSFVERRNKRMHEFYSIYVDKDARVL
ncbi:hypothetical protein PsorP6_013320 [Peronosclerospora sorghi]|uniref:Uncharacterized protein n=1 Tax=Peronosclerospora sorghi TaxID=230839 RepID=A0ACC0WGT0_9STRA|nr:hypothetical protein PsorP6_013320 [Peronosclerospora sorghi]